MRFMWPWQLSMGWTSCSPGSECRDTRNNRRPVPSRRLRATNHLYASRTTEGVAAMPTDLIVEEIHVIREALSKASGDDIRKIAEAAKARQMQSGKTAKRL